MFPIEVHALPLPGTSLAGKRGVDVTQMSRIHADKVWSSASFAGAQSLLASIKSGTRGVWRRARENLGSEAGQAAARDADAQKRSAGAREAGRHRRYWLWLDVAMTSLWVALLLSIVAYAVVEGETAMAQLDGLDLVATYPISR